MMLASQQIKHVFVLMLENHSFDQMLGFSGISGTDAVTGKPRTIVQPDGSNVVEGVEYKVGTPGINPMPIDPGHEFTDVVEQLGGEGAEYPFGGPYPKINNSGFAVNYTQQSSYDPPKAAPGDPLQCYSTAQVPVITALARDFVLCDNWFSSMPGPTWPNRFFVHAASSGGLDHSPTEAEIAEYFLVGYKFENGTIFDCLVCNKIPWRIYHGDIHPQSFALQNMTTYGMKDPARFKSYAHFASDIKSGSGYTPVYTFIEPSYGAVTTDYTCGSSQHPLDDVARGEWLIKCTYESIRNSPVWDSSLLIVTWDEHGGFYDHESPLSAEPPGDTPNSPDNNQSGFLFNLYGVRVPSVIVSPYIPKNLLDPRVYDHATVLATLKELYGTPSLTQRDGTALNLTSLLTLTSPRTDAPTTLPPPATSALPTCSTISACSGLPSAADSLELLARQPASSEPLEGNQPGFVHAALMHDLSVTPPEEHDTRRAVARSVTTKEDARNYFIEVGERVRRAKPPE